MDFGYIVQKICYYMMNPEQNLPVASDERQATEIEKMRKAISDFCEGKRNIRPEYQGIAREAICLELTTQMLKEQRGKQL